MTKQTVKQAYQSIRPGDEAKERMLNNILFGASEMPPERNHMNNRSKTIRHAVRIVAVACLLLVLGIAAYAAYVYSLQDLILVYDKPFPDGETTETFDCISLQGFSDSPSYKAAKEYRDFLSDYDPDGQIRLSSDNAFECPEEYYSYNCYTQEIQDKIDEICEKYHLELLGRGTIVNQKMESLSCEEILEQMGLPELRNTAAEAVHKMDWGYYYHEGTFQIEGDITLTGETAHWHHTISYRLRRTMKTSFDDNMLNIYNFEDYEQWRYTMHNGTEAILSLGRDKALIIVDLEESFVVVNILDFHDSENCPVEAFTDRATLEAFADAFDFSQLS